MEPQDKTGEHRPRSGIENFPEEKRAEAFRIVQEISRLHSGPLPDPETLEQYDRIIPSGAERIMQLQERQAAHRHSCENRDQRMSVQGQWIGLTVTLFLGAAGYHLGMHDHDWLAGVVFTTTIGAVVTVFVLGGRKPQISEDMRLSSSTIDGGMLH